MAFTPRQNRKSCLYPALTLMETVVALAVVAIVCAVLLPQLRAIQNSWDTSAQNSETLQNGRVLFDHLNRSLSTAVRIAAVSDSSTASGYVEFEDNAESIFRYDVDVNNYVEFGPVGNLGLVAGPVSQFQFTCYDGNDFATAITDVNEIRFIKLQTTLTNSAPMGQDLTLTTHTYLRTNGNSADADLVGWWKLDETSGKAAADSSGYDNDGALRNMVGDEWTAGQVDGALAFDGDNDYVVCADDPDITDQITLCAWVRHHAFTGDYERYVTVRGEIAVIRKHSDNGRLEFYISTDGILRHLRVSDVLIEAQWHHVAGTWDGTTQRLYIDGEEIDSQTPGGALDAPTDGVSISSPTEAVNGLLDDVRIYSRALSAEEVAELANVLNLRQFTEAKADSDTTSITISTPSDTNEADLLIAAVATDGDTDASLAPPIGEGWTQINLNDYNGEVTFGAWWKSADAAESASHQFTWSGGQQAYGWMMRFTGHDTTDPIDSSMGGGADSSSPTSPSVTASVAGCIILRLGGFDDGYITVDDPGLSGHMAITMDCSNPPAVTYEEFTEAKAGFDTTSLTISTPAGTAGGDLLICAVVTDGDNNPSLAPPAGEGWAEIELDDRGGKVTLGAWWKLADASESPSHQFTWANSQEAYGWIMRFTGHDPSGPIHTWGKSEGASTSPDCPFVTTTAANCTILRIGGFEDDDIDLDDTGLAEHTDITMDKSNTGFSSCSGGAGYQQQATPGTTDHTDFNLTDSEEYVTLTVAIAPDATGGGGVVSGGAGYVKQANGGISGTSNFSLAASRDSRVVTIGIKPNPFGGGGAGLEP